MQNFRENTNPLLREYSHEVEEIQPVQLSLPTPRWKLADLTRRLQNPVKNAIFPKMPGRLSICFESPSDVNDPVAEEQKTAEKSAKSENGYKLLPSLHQKDYSPRLSPSTRPSP